MQKRCAIYHRLSIPNTQQINKEKEELIKYCKEVLKIDNIDVFIDEGTVTNHRENFENMMKRIENEEFTDLLVYSMDRLYKPRYNLQIYKQIIKNIENNNVHIHSIKEEKYSY